MFDILVSVVYRFLHEQRRLRFDGRRYRFLMNGTAKITLVGVAIPTAKHKIAIVENQNFIDHFLDIGPSIFDIERKKFAIDI
jgi:hypothetical protein